MAHRGHLADRRRRQTKRHIRPAFRWAFRGACRRA
jgi:hypothetical protein